MRQPEPDISWSSDRSLRIGLGDVIDDVTHRRVVAAWKRLHEAKIAGVVDVTPAYTALQVVVDPLCVDALAVEKRVREVVRGVEDATGAGVAEGVVGRVVDIPVCYGGEFGPDLHDVATMHAMSVERVIELHSGAEYRVQFIGFVPGFAYLSGLPTEIHTVRLATPRRRVEAGSVGIAGGQTGVYPRETAGGWRIIGRTPRVMFDAMRTEANGGPSLLTMGDRVRFVAVSTAEFAEMEREGGRTRG